MKAAGSRSIMHLLISVLVICSVVIQNAAVSRPRLEFIPRVEISSESSGEGSLVKLICRPGPPEQLPKPCITRWYKVGDDEEQEFFRYERTGNGQKQYPVDIPFTNVDEDESDGNEVALYNVTELTSGLYKCTQQISAEVGPDHLVAVWRTRLNVAAPGIHSPMHRILVNIGPASSVSLSCDLTVRFNRTYGYKWFKESTEIYKYIPWNLEQPEQAFPVPGVSVNLQQSNGSHIMLEDLTMDSRGNYKCVAHVNAPRTATHVHQVAVLSYGDISP